MQRQEICTQVVGLTGTLSSVFADEADSDNLVGAHHLGLRFANAKLNPKSSDLDFSSLRVFESTCSRTIFYTWLCTVPVRGFIPSLYVLLYRLYPWL